MSGLQNLDTFKNEEFKRGASYFKQVLWHFCSSLFFKSSFPFYGIKVKLLKLFGAKVGNKVLIKPHVNIKFPWRLIIRDNVWIGEQVWIDNLDTVFIGNNVCLSQGAMLLCGNHNYKSAAFELFTAPITIQNHVWICAKAIVGPGVLCEEGAILKPLSFANNKLIAGGIYCGNPAVFIKYRF